VPSDKEDMRSPEEYAEFVLAVLARNQAEAEQYRELLNDHDIPAVICAETVEVVKTGEADEQGDVADPPPERQMTHGVPIMVPDAMLDEASEIIADREDVDEFQCAEADELEDEDDEEFGFNGTVGGPGADDIYDDDDDNLWADDKEENPDDKDP